MGNNNQTTKPSLDSNNQVADAIQSMISNVTGLSLNALKASQEYKFVQISYPEDSDELTILPIELWNEILMMVDEKSLATQVPRVSRLLYHFTSEDSDVWKRKCHIKYRGENQKPESWTWKKYYLVSVTKFFPLFGCTIGKTKHDELCAVPGAVARVSGSSRYVDINGVNFWVHGTDNIFASMYICRGIYVIPADWEQKGLTWDKSWNEYKEWCKKSFGNYKVLERPYKSEFQNNMCFTASLETLVREDSDVIYAIKFDFSFEIGDDDTKNTLYSISHSSWNDVNQSKADFEARYNAKQCDEGDDDLVPMEN